MLELAFLTKGTLKRGNEKSPPQGTDFLLRSDRLELSWDRSH